jgi:hypothetical protein
MLGAFVVVLLVGHGCRLRCEARRRAMNNKQIRGPLYQPDAVDLAGALTVLLHCGVYGSREGDVARGGCLRCQELHFWCSEGESLYRPTPLMAGSTPRSRAQ